MEKLVDPVMAAYAKEIGADDILTQDPRRQVMSRPRCNGLGPSPATSRRDEGRRASA